MKGRSQAPLEYSLSEKADFPFTINPVKSKDHHSISHTHSSHTDSLWAYYTCFHNMSIKLSKFTRLNTHTHTHTHLREAKLSLLSRFCELTDDDMHMLRTVSKEEAFNKCNPIDANPPGSPVPGILQARTLEWVAISFSNAGKWKVKVKSLSCVQLSATPWTAAHLAPPSMGFSRQEYWSGVPLPSPSINVTCCYYFTKFKLEEAET